MMRAELKKKIVRKMAMLTLVAMGTGCFAVGAYADDGRMLQGGKPAEIEIQSGEESSEEDEALNEYANEVLKDYDAKMEEADELNMEDLLEEGLMSGEEPESIGDLENEGQLSEEEEKALKEKDEKYEKALSAAKLSGKKDKDFSNIVNSQIGRESVWEVGFVDKLMKQAGITDIKTKAKTVEEWIEEISKAEAASLETIKANAEKAAKGISSDPVKLVSYTPYEDKDMKASDLVFFAESESGEVVYKVGVYSEKNFAKNSKGIVSQNKAKAILITSDSQGNVIEETFNIVKGIDKDYNELQVQPLEKKEELEKAGEDLSKIAFISEKEIVIDGVVSIEAEKVAIKAAEDKIIMKETGTGLTVTVKLSAKAFGEPVDNYSIEVREITKSGEDYNYCLSKAKAEAQENNSLKEVVEGSFVEVLVLNAAGEKVVPTDPLEVEILYDEAHSYALGQSIKAFAVGEKTELMEAAINEAAMTEEIKAEEAALMEEMGIDEEEKAESEEETGAAGEAGEKVESAEATDGATEEADNEATDEAKEEPQVKGEAINSISFKTANLSAMGMVICEEEIEEKAEEKTEAKAEEKLNQEKGDEVDESKEDKAAPEHPSAQHLQTIRKGGNKKQQVVE